MCCKILRTIFSSKASKEWKNKKLWMRLKVTITREFQTPRGWWSKTVNSLRRRPISTTKRENSWTLLDLHTIGTSSKMVLCQIESIMSSDITPNHRTVTAMVESKLSLKPLRRSVWTFRDTRSKNGRLWESIPLRFSNTSLRNSKRS